MRLIESKRIVCDAARLYTSHHVHTFALVWGLSTLEVRIPVCIKLEVVDTLSQWQITGCTLAGQERPKV